MYRSLFASLGERQSPINVITEDVIFDPDICKPSSMKFNYHEGDCHELVALPSTWMLRTNDQCKSSLTASHLSGEFRLLQVHGHWGETAEGGSEHAIDSRRYSSEIHFAFWNTNYQLDDAAYHGDGMAVVAVLLTEGKHNKHYAHISDAIPEAVEKDTPVEISTSLDVASLMPLGSDYLYYEGSLTTPPYSQCVLWTIMLEPVEVSSSQLEQFRRIGVNANCREVQPLCGRHIFSSCKMPKS